MMIRTDDPRGGLTAKAAATWYEAPRLTAGVRRSVALWYEFQELRYTRNRLWARLADARRRWRLPVCSFTPSERPVFVCSTSATGLPRLVRLGLLSGGAGLDDKRGNPLICTLREQNGAMCLAVDGELDLASVASFLGSLTHAADGGRDVVVDLKNLQYIDSSGINALLRARERHTLAGQRIVLADVPARIRRILDIIALQEVIPMFPTVDAALAGLRNGTKPA